MMSEQAAELDSSIARDEAAERSRREAEAERAARRAEQQARAAREEELRSAEQSGGAAQNTGYRHPSARERTLALHARPGR